MRLVTIGHDVPFKVKVKDLDNAQNWKEVEKEHGIIKNQETTKY